MYTSTALSSAKRICNFPKYRNVIVKLVTTGRTANSFVTTNERFLFGRMRPDHGTWTHAINQPHGGL